MNKTDIINRELRIARQKIRPGSHWRHYKGGIYKITGHVFDANVDAIAALYQRVDGPGYEPFLEDDIVFSRPIVEWDQDVNIPIEGGVQRVKRFEEVRGQNVLQWITV